MNSALNILQITDLHILAEAGQTMSGVDTEASFKQILDAAIERHNNFDLILVTGDLAQNPCHSSYQRINKILKKHPIPAICLAGNHDDFLLMQQIFNSEQINCSKQRLIKGWQIICLNSKKTASPGGQLAAEELGFLNHQLSKHSELPTLIAVHHHPVPTHSQWMDTMIIENNEDLFSIIQQHPQVKAICCGHIHQQLEITENNLLILAAPSSCFQFKPRCTEYTLDNLNPGYRHLSLTADGKILSKVYRVPLIAK